MKVLAYGFLGRGQCRRLCQIVADGLLFDQIIVDIAWSQERVAAACKPLPGGSQRSKDLWDTSVPTKKPPFTGCPAVDLPP